MKTDETLKINVQAAIKWEPLLNKALIDVTAKDGVITLEGSVDVFAKKKEVEIAAKNVAGVKTVINKIEVNFDRSLNKSDEEIIAEVKNDIKSRQILIDKIRVLVKDGWVTLEGELKWNYQIEIAKNAANYIIGVKGISNNIKLELKTHDQIELAGIERALARSPILNVKNIQVKVLADRVILKGKVDSLYQKDEVERIVWKAPGVWNLDNQLEVENLQEIPKR